MGKFLAFLLVFCAVVGGGFMYYQQVYAYYYEVPATGETDVQLTPQGADRPEPLAHEGFEAIDADSSPIRYRACFTTSLGPQELTETYREDDEAVPLTAPGWFGCFDAVEIGEALEAGRARAFLGQENIRYGIDRVVAIHEDGRGWAWNQINHCGEVVFDGQPAPDDCPPAPEGY